MAKNFSDNSYFFQNNTIRGQKFSWQKIFVAKKFRGKKILFHKILGKKFSWQKISFETIFKGIQPELDMKESKRGTFALTLGYTSMDSNAYSDNRSSILHTVNPKLVNNVSGIRNSSILLVILIRLTLNIHFCRHLE